MAKLNVKKGDTVKVISGKDKGSTGQIKEVDAKSNRVTIEGVNTVIKHVKPRKAQEKGGRIEQSAPIDASNVMVICNACGMPTRVGKKVEVVDGKEKRVRVCKKCGATLDVAKSKAKTAKKATKKKATTAKKKTKTESDKASSQE